MTTAPLTDQDVIARLQRLRDALRVAEEAWSAFEDAEATWPELRGHAFPRQVGDAQNLKAYREDCEALIFGAGNLTRNLWFERRIHEKMNFNDALADALGEPIDPQAFIDVERQFGGQIDQLRAEVHRS